MISVLQNSRGQGLVQVLVAAGIGTIIMTAIAASQNNQARENRAMSEKLAANDFQNQMLRSLLDGSVCSSLLNGKTFDSTNAVAGNPNQPSIAIPLSSIPVSTDPGAPVLAAVGDRVSAISNTLKIDDQASVPFRVVGLVGSVNGTTGTFTGSFLISFNQNQLIRSIKAASTRVILKTSAVGTTQTVTGCTTIMDNTCWVSGPLGLTTVACGNVGIGTTTPRSTLHVNGYLQIATESISPPSPADCSQPEHRGRMEIYTPSKDVHRICFCPQNIGGSPLRWWCTPAAVLPP